MDEEGASSCNASLLDLVSGCETRGGGGSGDVEETFLLEDAPFAVVFDKLDAASPFPIFHDKII